MSFRDQQYAALKQLAEYNIFASVDGFIPRDEFVQFRHDDLNGVVQPNYTQPWRQNVNLPFDPQDLYSLHNTTPSQGYHVWNPLDAAINNAKILPSPPRPTAGIIGMVQHVNYPTGWQMQGGDNAPWMTKSAVPIDWADPINGRETTLGWPFIVQHNYVSQAAYKQ